MKLTADAAKAKTAGLLMVNTAVNPGGLAKDVFDVGWTVRHRAKSGMVVARCEHAADPGATVDATAQKGTASGQGGPVL
jgi:hypothetical protein